MTKLKCKNCGKIVSMKWFLRSNIHTVYECTKCHKTMKFNGCVRRNYVYSNTLAIIAIYRFFPRINDYTLLEQIPIGALFIIAQRIMTYIFTFLLSFILPCQFDLINEDDK